MKKTGEAVGSPRMVCCCWPRLERDPHAELKLPHLAVGLQAADNAVSAAVNTAVGIGIDGMVEHIEELRLELSLDPLRDGEVLEDGHVRQELARPSELIAMDVAESPNLGTSEWSAGSTVGGKRSHRRKVDYLPGLIVEASRAHVEAPVLAGPARSGIPVGVAFAIARGVRQNAGDDHGCVPLPSPHQQVRSSAYVAQEVLA